MKTFSLLLWNGTDKSCQQNMWCNEYIGVLSKCQCHKITGTYLKLNIIKIFIGIFVENLINNDFDKQFQKIFSQFFFDRKTIII